MQILQYLFYWTLDIELEVCVCKMVLHTFL